MTHFDFEILMLNIASVTVLAVNLLSDYLTPIGGFLVMVSIATLNLAKAYNYYKSGKKKEENEKEEEQN